MKLSEIFSQLASSELSQTAYVDEVTGAIKAEKYPQLVSHVNLGLMALYKRFALKEGRVLITLQANRITYPLDTNEDVAMAVEDGDEEFDDGIIKIERIYTDSGTELAVNDASDPYSCFTSSLTTLRVPIAVVNKGPDLPEELLTDDLTVVYRAKHPLIVVKASFNPERVNVALPYSHLEPLLWFVASRVNNPMGMTNEFHAGNSYAAKYEKACQELEVRNIQVDQGRQNTRLVANGWV